VLRRRGGAGPFSTGPLLNTMPYFPGHSAFLFPSQHPSEEAKAKAGQAPQNRAKPPLASPAPSPSFPNRARRAARRTKTGRRGSLAGAEKERTGGAGPFSTGPLLGTRGRFAWSLCLYLFFSRPPSEEAAPLIWESCARFWSFPLTVAPPCCHAKPPHWAFKKSPLQGRPPPLPPVAPLPWPAQPPAPLSQIVLPSQPPLSVFLSIRSRQLRFR
jgi:hypothetical protein